MSELSKELAKIVDSNLNHISKNVKLIKSKKIMRKQRKICFETSLRSFRRVFGKQKRLRLNDRVTNS